MKIFLSFLQGKPGHPIPAYSFWEYYIKKGIEEAGHEWDECSAVDWAEGLVPKTTEEQATWKAKAWADTVAWLKKHPADLFLSYLYPEQIDGTAVKEIKQMGIPCVNFFCDHVRMFSKVPPEFSVFDLNWVPEHKALDMYKKAGYPYINLPMPMWVAPEHRVLKPEANSDITFIGSKDIQRQLFFEEIISKFPQLPLKIYGHGWNAGSPELPDGPGQEEGPGTARPGIKKSYSRLDQLKFQFSFIKEQGISAYIRKLQQRNFRPAISVLLQSKLMGKPSFDEYIHLTQQSMITVGINRYPSYRHPIHRPGTYSRLRDLEAPMLGACYLTEQTGGIDDMYQPGKEILIFSNADEFSAQAIHLRKDAALRSALRKNAQARALNDHSIPRSLARIIDSIVK